MLPFPPREDLEILIGDSVAQIKIDPNSVQILFESGLELFVEERLEHRCSNETPYVYQCEAWCDGPSLLHRLIQKTVARIDRQDWTLELTLDDGSSLTLHSENSNFESGHFKHADGSIIPY
jgi:hypothetical protein